MKKLLFSACIVGIFSFSAAQTGNETLGNSVTPESTVPDYNGSTIVNAPGSSLTTGDYHTLIGDGAGSSLTGALYSVMIGTAAGALLTTDSDQVIIGAFANDLTTTGGFDNVIIGTRAARFSNGSDNTIIGNEAGLNLTSGFDNTLIGEEAGQALTTGDDNVFIGEDAGFNTTTADDNTFVGVAAGRQNTTGARNAFFGKEAGYDNSTGYRNTFVGDSTGIDVGVGRLNTFVGQGAGSATEHADYNTFVGVEAGGDNNRTNATDNANRNTYMGVFTGFSNREGEDNVGVGAFANYTDPSNFSILNITGRNNVLTSTLTRDRTTFVGAQSYPNNSDVIILGYRGRVDGQYGMALGNLSRVQGDYSVAIGQEVNVVNANTLALGGDTNANRLSVGIGTTGANQNASLELADTDKGLLINRLTTTQRNDMITAAASGNPLDNNDEGLMVYDSGLKSIFVWTGTSWQEVGTAACAAPTDQVSDVVFGTATDTTLMLSGFTAPSGGADGYVIYINDTNTFTAPTDGDTPVANTAWNNAGQQAIYFGTSVFSNVTVTGLSSGTEYYFQIYAYNDCDNSTTYETIGFNGTDVTETSASVDMVAGIGIGTTSPSSAMDVVGSVRALNRNSSGALFKCEANVEGTFGYDTEDKVLKVCTLNSGNYEWRALSFK